MATTVTELRVYNDLDAPWSSLVDALSLEVSKDVECGPMHFNSCDVDDRIVLKGSTSDEDNDM